jgi:hypothetical protein
MPEALWSQSRIWELRQAADQSRAFADFLHEPAAKRGFVELARRWDAEADALEKSSALSVEPP